MSQHALRSLLRAAKPVSVLCHVCASARRSLAGQSALDSRYDSHGAMFRKAEKGKSGKDNRFANAARNPLLLQKYEAGDALTLLDWKHLFRALAYVPGQARNSEPRDSFESRSYKCFEHFLETVTPQPDSVAYCKAVTQLSWNLYYAKSDRTRQHEIMMRIETIFPADSITEKSVMIAMILASMRGNHAMWADQQLGMTALLLRRLRKVERAAPWDRQSMDPDDSHLPLVQLQKRKFDLEKQLEQFSTRAEAYTERVLALDPGAIATRSSVQILVGYGMLACAAVKGDGRIFETYLRLRQENGLEPSPSAVQSWAYAVYRLRSKEMVTPLLDELRKTVAGLAALFAAIGTEKRATRGKSKIRTRIATETIGESSLLHLSGQQREAARSWALCHATLVSLKDSRAQEVRLFVKEHAPPEVYAILVDYWIRELVIEHPEAHKDVDVRQLLKQIYAETSHGDLSPYAYSHALAGFVQGDATPVRALDIWRDMVALAKEDRLPLQVTMFVSVIDRLNAAVHEASNLREARLWGALVAESYEDYRYFAEAGKVTDALHREIPHGLTVRTVAALSRAGMTTKAVQLTFRWISSVRHFEEALRRNFRLVSPWTHWVSSMGGIALGQLYKDLPPAKPRHLAIFASWLLRFGLHPTTWMLEQVNEVLRDVDAMAQLSAPEKRALQQTAKSIVFHNGLDATSFTPMNSKITSPADILEDPEAEAALETALWELPIKPNHSKPSPPKEKDLEWRRDDAQSL